MAVKLWMAEKPELLLKPNVGYIHYYISTGNMSAQSVGSLHLGLWNVTKPYHHNKMADCSEAVISQVYLT